MTRSTALSLGSPETELARPLLELVTDLLRTDHAYAERIQEHYRVFRGRLERKGVGKGWFETADSRSKPGRARRPH